MTQDDMVARLCTAVVVARGIIREWPDPTSEVIYRLDALLQTLDLNRIIAGQNKGAGDGGGSERD